MIKTEILKILQKLTGHKFVEVVLQGNSAIDSALSIIPKDKIILIPEEGGWIHYHKAPKKLGLKILEVKCDDAKINLNDLKRKLTSNSCDVFLYQNPGGYFAEQPMKEIYELCQKHNCVVIMDVSGGIGTELCDGKFADIIVGSFGEWKLVEAKKGGFISCQNKGLFDKVKKHTKPLTDGVKLNIILTKLHELPERIKFLLSKREKIIRDLKEYDIIHPKEKGFVVIVKYKDDTDKSKIISYCKQNSLPFTECPRYIRLNKPAISIEVKQLQN
jgi:glycine/serine hydroxymethyltransferase